MLETVFGVVGDAIESELKDTRERVNVLGQFRGGINSRIGMFKGLLNGLMSSFKGLLGQFSNKNSYSDAELRSVLESSLERSLVGTSEDNDTASSAGADVMAPTDRKSVV